tara:strand:- start:485 stop:637 length:153 start_codon:yes stop_codon:yes gene_type:complete
MAQSPLLHPANQNREDQPHSADGRQQGQGSGHLGKPNGQGGKAHDGRDQK